METLNKEEPKVFKVIVGSCFPVEKYSGLDEKAAIKAFDLYCLKSSFGHGEVGHEPVILMCGSVEQAKYVWKPGDKVE